MGLFKSDTVPIFWDIAIAYNNIAGTQIIELLQNNPHKIRQVYGLEGVKGRSNGFLDELRCFASISSLAEVGLPLIDGDSTESERIMKAGSYEWKTALFELEVFRRAGNSPEWVECGVAALKNAGGFRYRIHRLLDLITDNIGAQVGEWGRIGVRVKPVGYGYPQSYDRITFTGNWKQEFNWVQEHPFYVVVNNYGGSGTALTPTPTPTPTPDPEPTTAPTLTVTRTIDSTGYIYADADTNITLAASGLMPDYPFSIRFMSGGLNIKSDTYTSTTAEWELTFKPSALNQYGSKNYTVSLVHGSFSTDNPTSLNVVIPSFNIYADTTYTVGAGRTFTCNMNVTPYKDTWYNQVWTFSFAKDDGSGNFVDKTDYSENKTTSFNAFVQAAPISLSAAQFSNAGWGDGKYKLKATKGAYSIYSAAFNAVVG